jgi:hypothetical protein
MSKSKSELFYDWRSVSQYVLVSIPLWDLRTYISCRRMAVWKLRSCFCGAPSLTRGSAICSVITQWSESCRIITILYCLIWDSPNLEGQVPVFISPRNSVAQLYPQTLSALHVASCDSQDCGGGILTLPHNLEGQVSVYMSLRNRMVQSKVEV